MAVKTTFTIRPMTGNDLDQALRLSLAEGWNQTVTDWKFLLENPDNICIVAEKENRIAGTATALIHSGKIAWIGMVLVDKALRGMGAGKMLMSDIITRLGNTESVKLDATLAGQPLYKSLGFVDENRIFRMTATQLKSNDFQYTGETPQKLTRERLQTIIDHDSTIFGAGRAYLLKHLLQKYPEKAFFYPGNIDGWGYILGRDGSRFNYIGPVCASSTGIARDLISAAIRSLVNQPVALDIPADKTDLIRWLEFAGFVKQREFARMYLKENPYPGKIEYQYLISGPEFG